MSEPFCVGKAGAGFAHTCFAEQRGKVFAQHFIDGLGNGAFVAAEYFSEVSMLNPGSYTRGDVASVSCTSRASRIVSGSGSAGEASCSCSGRAGLSSEAADDSFSHSLRRA